MKEGFVVVIYLFIFILLLLNSFVLDSFIISFDANCFGLKF